MVSEWIVLYFSFITIFFFLHFFSTIWPFHSFFIKEIQEFYFLFYIFTSMEGKGSVIRLHLPMQSIQCSEEDCVTFTLQHYTLRNLWEIIKGQFPLPEYWKLGKWKYLEQKNPQKPGNISELLRSTCRYLFSWLSRR